MPILVVSDPDTGKSQRIEIDDARMSPLVGLRIGQVVEGSVADMPGSKIKFTGGTDKDGIPMRPDVHGSAKVDIILSNGIGYSPKRKGERKRVIVRGNTISNETTYLNFKILEKASGKESESEEKTVEEQEKEQTEESE